MKTKTVGTWRFALHVNIVPAPLEDPDAIRSLAGDVPAEITAATVWRVRTVNRYSAKVQE
jgi:hypothetical protein